MFIGEDLYFVTSQQDLMRLSTGDAPVPLATGVGYSSAQTTDNCC